MHDDTPNLGEGGSKVELQRWSEAYLNIEEKIYRVIEKFRNEQVIRGQNEGSRKKVVLYHQFHD